MPVKFTNLPFSEAQDFLREKVSLPTKTWKDIQDGMHSRAFVIAGAEKNELLSDIRGSLQKALDNGTTLADFRKDFDATVQKHGWNYNGSRGWRTAVIFNTNMRTAFSAGNEAQLQKTKATRPYARYIAGLSAEPRPEHLEWHNTILPIDHPWWDTHTPPNGWGCKCRKVSVSRRELERNNWEVASKPPTAPSDQTGIDESFFYNPGRAAWGQKPALRTVRDGESPFETLSTGDWQSEGQSAKVDLDPEGGVINENAVKTQEGMASAIKKFLGGEEKVFSFKEGKFRHDLNVNAKALAEHLKDNASRAPFLPLLPEVLENPFEVWQSFQRHRDTGKVVLRTRYIKAFAVEKGADKGLLFVADAVDGQMQGLTMIPMSGARGLNKARRGKLIFGRGKK